MVDGRVMIDIIYEDNHLLVVNKPINVLVQGDSTSDKDLLSLLKDDIKKRYHKPGNVYLGLIHRLDRPVSGVMVFAKTSKAASRLSEQVRTHQLKKVYLAVVLGSFDKKSGTFIDYLWKDERTNTVYVDSKKGKESILEYVVLGERNGYSLVKIFLKTGRSHQIRVQFSSRGHALYGDQRYNRSSEVGEQIALFATSLSFFHPVTKEKMTFDKKPPSKYPWNLFH